MDSSDSPSSGSISPGPSTDLEQYRIPNLPPAAYYVRDFITPAEEQALLDRLAETPQPKWKAMATGRRLQYWGGTMSKGGTLLPEPMPGFLANIAERIDHYINLGINQVLVNEYQPDHGISPHEDGPAFHPLVATLSLASHTTLDIYHYLSSTPSPPMTVPPPTPGGGGGGAIAAVPLSSILLQPRSLLVISSSIYSSHLHGIAPRPHDTGDGAANRHLASVEEGFSVERGVRTSLTFRRAEKVVKGGAARALVQAVYR